MQKTSTAVERKLRPRSDLRTLSDMSEPIQESIPTSFSKRSDRPTKKRAITPVSQQSAQVEALFANPERAAAGIAVGPRLKALTAPPEIVANVQGSSAGAGSGEFHVYKASRRREYERLRIMDEEVRLEEAEKEFREKKEERERMDEEKLSKNRAKREKAKQRMKKKELGGIKNGQTVEPSEANEVGGEEKSVKKKLAPAKTLQAGTGLDKATEGSTSIQDVNAVTQEENTGLTIHDDD